MCDTKYRLYVYRLTDKISNGIGVLPFRLQQCFTTVWEILMSPVPCLNVRAKSLFCTVLYYASHSFVWSAVRPVGRQIAQTDRQTDGQLYSLYFDQSASQSVDHKIFQLVSQSTVSPAI